MHYFSDISFERVHRWQLSREHGLFVQFVNMENTRLNTSLRTNVVTAPYFHGVVLSSELPNVWLPCERAFVVINTLTVDEARAGRIGHFVAVILRSKDSPVIFFDSYAKQLNFYNRTIRTFVNSFRKPVRYLSKRIQSDQTSVCGLYCAYVAYHFSQDFSRSLAQVLSRFQSHDLVTNDKTVICWFFYTFDCAHLLGSRKQKTLLRNPL